MNIIYHNECGCIYSGECNFRYFSVIDYSIGERKTIAICSDFIRQKIQEYYHDFERFKKWVYNKTIYGSNIRKPDEYGEPDHRYYEVVVESILSNYYRRIPDRYYESRFGNSISSRRCFLTVCERPKIYIYVSIPAMIQHYVDSPKRSYRLLEPLIDEIEHYLKQIRYKKYKNKHRESIKILKQIGRTYNKEEKNLLWIELINELFRETTTAQKLTT